MFKNILALEGVTVLDKKQQGNINGGVTREESCATLGGMITSGGYQGDLSMGFHFYKVNCGDHGIPMF